MLKSSNRLLGVARKTAVAMDGSVKWRFDAVRMAVFDLMDGDQAGWSSITNIRLNALRYASKVGAVIVFSSPSIS